MDVNLSRGRLARHVTAPPDTGCMALTLIHGGLDMAVAQATQRVEASTRQLREDCAKLARLLREMR